MSKRKEISTLSHVCNHCGRCCINRGDISLTPLDVFNISQYLHMTTKDFIFKYCEIGEQFDVVIRAQGAFKRCVFLKIGSKGNNLCEIYKVRPMPCYLYPLQMRPEMLNLFSKDAAPYCSKSKKQIRIMEFVNKNSNGRYSNEYIYIKKFWRAINTYYSHPNGLSEEEMFEYFFYNSSVSEVMSKVDKYLSDKA